MSTTLYQSGTTTGIKNPAFAAESGDHVFRWSGSYRSEPAKAAGYSVDAANPTANWAGASVVGGGTVQTHTFNSGAGRTLVAGQTVSFYVYATDSTTQLTVVTDSNVVPSAAFSYTSNGGGEVSFDASASAWADSWSWDFGDGSTGTGETITHVFANEGLQNVTLTVNHSWLKTYPAPSSLTKTVTSEETPPPPTFTAVEDSDPETDRTFVFTVDNPDARLAYTWNFGDTGTASGTSASHTYASAGSYTVTLTGTFIAPLTGSLETQQTFLVPVEAVNMKRPGDVLRLEYAGPVASGYPNQVANPSGDKGAWGWLTPVANSALTAESVGGQQALKYTAVSAAGGNYFRTEPFRVDPGENELKIGWKAYGARHTTRIIYTDIDGVQTGTSVYSVNGGTNTSVLPASSVWHGPVNYAVPATAPANTAFAQIEFRLWTGTSGGEVTGAGSTLAVREVMAYVKSTSGFADFNEGYTWVNILGPTSEIKVNREALNLGTLTARIQDSTLDPARYPDLHRGVPVRLTTETGYAVETLFEGKIDTAVATYVGGTKISLVAFDNISPLANTREPGGVVVASLPAILEGVGVPWNINGSTSQVPAPTIISFNENASLLDQVSISRDSQNAYAWVDRRNILQVQTGAYRDRANWTLFNENHYSDIALAYDPKLLINTVVIKWLRMDDVTLETEEITYGPYRDRDSILNYGVAAATVTVHGTSEGPIAAESIANAILAANANPSIYATRVRVPIRKDADLPNAILDIYDVVRVDNAEAVFSKKSRVTGITHDITPYKWTVEYSFGEVDALPAPSATPSPAPPTADTGGSSGGATDHGALTGLGDDDHTQYHNDARGDARYYTKAEVDALTTGGSTTIADAVTGASAISNSTTTLASTGLTAALESGKVYHFRAQGWYQSAATTTGFRVVVGATGALSVNNFRYTRTVWNANTPTKIVVTAFSSGAATTAVTAINTPYEWEIEGTIDVSTGGGIDILFASEVASSAVSVLPMSSLVVTEIT